MVKHSSNFVREHICRLVKSNKVIFEDKSKSTITWDPKWTQTGLRFHFEVKFHFGVS